MLLFVKSAKFRKKLNLQKNTQAKNEPKVSASPQTATPRHFRHASGKKSEGLGITTNRHATHFRHASGKKSEGLGITTNRHTTPFKARKRKKEAKVSDIATFLRHESGRHRQKAHRTGTKADTTGRKQAQKARHGTPEHRAVMGLW